MEYFYFLMASGSAGTKISGNIATFVSDPRLSAFIRGKALLPISVISVHLW
jgi:hypothetical protein